jgi:hypothetical protein
MCDAGLYCPTDTDCFDCDPCQAYSFTSCQDCTANGCVWCGMDAICVGAAVPIQLSSSSFSQITCTVEDFTNTCDSISSNVFPDPLYDAQSWIYDQINVEEVWKSGISKSHNLITFLPIISFGVRDELRLSSYMYFLPLFCSRHWHWHSHQ